MRLWKRRLRNDTALPAEGVRLFFGTSRGRIRRGFVVGPGPRPLREKNLAHNGIEFVWSGAAVPADGSVTVGIGYEGEPPPWGGMAVWLPVPGVSLADALAADEACRPLAESAHIGSATRFVTLRQRELDQRAELLRHQRFFLELDRDATPAYFERQASLTPQEVEARTRAIDTLLKVLHERVLLRGARANVAGGNALPLPLPADAEPVGRVSALISAPARRHYAGLASGQVAEVERAFESFACGRLRVTDTTRNLPLNGEPNSALYFLFAEVGFVALALGVEADFWGPLLNVLVRTQRLFMEAYGPLDPEERCWSAYGQNEPRPVTDAFIAELRRSFQGLGVPELERRAAEHARDAFRL